MRESKKKGTTFKHLDSRLSNMNLKKRMHQVKTILQTIKRSKMMMNSSDIKKLEILDTLTEALWI